MIYLLCGENDFELTNRLAQLKAAFDGEAERYDGADLNAEQLADIFAGQTLFSLKRLVIIDSPSSSSDLWQDIATWATRLAEDTQLVLVEPKPDKRTTTYKWLKKQATVEEFALIDERDTPKLIKWLETYAAAQNVPLTTAQARRLAERGGANQWMLAQAVDKLGLAGEINDEWIDTVIDKSPTENVFALFETALTGDVKRLSEIMSELRKTEDPYRVFGLVNSQLIQLVVLAYGDGNVPKVAADIGAKSSYPLQKMAPHAARLGKAKAGALLELFANADTKLKSSDANPWLVLENMLVRIGSLEK